MNAPDLPREVSIPGLFKVSVPASATHELVEDGSTLALHIRSKCDPLYLKSYDLPAQYSSVQSALKAEAERFLKEGILPVCKKIVGSDIESGEVNGAQ